MSEDRFSEKDIQARVEYLKRQHRESTQLVHKLGLVSDDVSDAEFRSRAIESLNEEREITLSFLDSTGAEMDRRRQELLEAQPNYAVESSDQSDEIICVNFPKKTLTDNLTEIKEYVAKIDHILENEDDTIECATVMKVLFDYFNEIACASLSSDNEIALATDEGLPQSEINTW